MNDDAETMTSAAKRALEAARASTSIMAINSAEFEVALDPRPESRAEVRKVADGQLKLFNERFDYFSKTRDEKVKSMLPDLKESVATYEKSMENTMRLAGETKEVALSDQSEHLRSSAMNSRALAEKLRAKMKAVAEELDARVDESAKQASEEYLATSRQLMVVAAVGIVFGVIAGFLIGQFGIVKPIVLLKVVMEAFARNDLKGEVPGKERGDEVGDMARTVEVFKTNAIEVERLKSDQLATEQRTAAQRRTDMNKLADDFEGAAGEIIETVSSASTELEASARTLSATAVRSEEQATMVAAAS
jgi:methyl-accepting chemotaxis protein